MEKTIFITGASRGFGKLWTEAFLKRGDKVAATSRNIEAYKDLVEHYGEQFLPIALDITDRDAVFKAVNQAKDHFGKLDVVINNAGYGVFGAVEEVGEKITKDVFEANVFGTLWVTQAALPIFRAIGSGHVIQLSSVLGIWSLPTLGIYNATKFAVEGLIETIGSETAHLGIKTTLIEPNGFATDWAGASAVQTSSEITDYNAVREAFAETGDNPDTWGKPEATVEPVLNLIDNQNPPQRLLFGKIAYHVVNEVYTKRLEDIQNWKEVSVAAHGH